VAEQLLNVLGARTTLVYVCAETMPQHMRRHALQPNLQPVLPDATPHVRAVKLLAVALQEQEGRLGGAGYAGTGLQIILQLFLRAAGEEFDDALTGLKAALSTHR
jgi:hypothetical protein